MDEGSGVARFIGSVQLQVQRTVNFHPLFDSTLAILSTTLWIFLVLQSMIPEGYRVLHEGCESFR